MSYRINERTADLERALQDAQLMQKHHPEAELDELPDGTRVWSSEKVVPTHVDVVIGQVDVAPFMAQGPRRHEAFIVGYAMVGRMRLYRLTSRFSRTPATDALKTIREHHPEAHAALLALVS